MSAPDLSAVTVDSLPEGLVEAGTYSSIAEGEEHGLVALALGYDYWLVPATEAAGYRLLVEPAAASRLRPHLIAYARERLRWPPPPIVDAAAGRSLYLLEPLVWSALILALFRFGGSWTEYGVLDARAVFQRGEVWRAFTALFLHGSAAHVVSNALSGAFVFAAVLSTFGRLRGWSLLALAAVAGNLIVAASNYPAPYRSVGASTAIFAGVGLLTGRALRVVLASRHPHRWRSLLIPFGAGLTVLAMHGAADSPQVDLGAHLCGWLAGLICGAIATRTAAQSPTARA
ncbi:MAG: rhomboid family intramembrane serine protease [Verrucomicrobiota bacterium]